MAKSNDKKRKDVSLRPKKTPMKAKKSPKGKPEKTQNLPSTSDGKQQRKVFNKKNTKNAEPRVHTSRNHQPLDRKAKKELVESRKRKRKPNYDLEKEALSLWEKMRQRDLDAEERTKIVSTTLQKMKGTLLQMAMSHASSRVLQSCVKHCSESEREQVFQELRPHLLVLAKNTYACHLAKKMLDQAKKNQLQHLLTSLHGNVVSLVRHPSGSAVVEHAYHVANGTQKLNLLSEFYSSEYRLFKGIIPNNRSRIADILNAEPSKRKSVLDHMSSSLQPILEKGIVDHSIVHRALVEYLSICSKKSVAEIIEQLSGPLLVRMVHTRDGARIGILCVRNGSPKERKKIVKGMKTHVLKTAHDDHGYALLLAVLDVVDDTELVNKIIMSEIAKGIKDLCLNKYGHRLVLHLLAPNTPRYFPADLLQLLQCPITQASNSKISGEESKEKLVDSAEVKDAEIQDAEVEDAEEDGAEKDDCSPEKVVSKKDPLLRRKELLLKSGFAEKLAEECATHAGELLRSPVGKDVMYEVACGGSDGIMKEHTVAVRKVIAELAALPKSDTSEGEGEKEEEHVLEHYHASRTIRRLILRPYKRSNGEPCSFQKLLWESAFKGKCSLWATGHSSKVVTAFLECGDPAVKSAAKSEIKSLGLDLKTPTRK